MDALDHWKWDEARHKGEGFFVRRFGVQGLIFGLAAAVILASLFPNAPPIQRYISMAILPVAFLFLGRWQGRFFFKTMEKRYEARKTGEA